jgi:diacylglycerol O-acyltransferase
MTDSTQGTGGTPTADGVPMSGPPGRDWTGGGPIAGDPAGGGDGHTDRPLDWASERTMNPLDTLMWRGDNDRRLRGTVCAIELLDLTPDWQRFAAAIEWGSRMVPRFRERVVDSPLGVGPPSWAVDPAFDLSYHLRRVRVPGGGTWSGLLEAAQQIAMTPLDQARPPWEAVLFEGLPDGKAALLIKAHHAATDGLGAIYGLALLHSRVREPTPDKPQPPTPAAERLSAAEVVTRQVVTELNQSLPMAMAAASNGLRAARHPRAALRAGLRYAQSVPKVLGLSAPPGSPLLRQRSLSWRFATFDIPFPGLRAAGKAAGATVNDAYLTGLVGAFRIYHELMGHPIDTMPVALPISIRGKSDTGSGNKIAVGRFAAPVWLADPYERMVTIREQVRAARREPAADVFSAVGPALAWLPAPVLAAAGHRTTGVSDLQASNVPGIMHDAYLAGARIERLYPFGPLPGCAVMATMVTHGQVGCLGINYDAASVTDPGLFARSIIDGFTEVLALGNTTGRPAQRA